jgi:hypothetical protein
MTGDAYYCRLEGKNPLLEDNVRVSCEQGGSMGLGTIVGRNGTSKSGRGPKVRDYFSGAEENESGFLYFYFGDDQHWLKY